MRRSARKRGRSRGCAPPSRFATPGSSGFASIRCSPGCVARRSSAPSSAGSSAPPDMRAMVMTAPQRPLVARELPTPEPGPAQVRLRVTACGLCRTDLHILDGELPARRLPLVPGHQVVGVVDAVGAGASRWKPGQRVGVPWLAWTCGACAYCRAGQENLCDAARFTGYDVDGGYAGHALADERFCFPIPAAYADAEAAPLLCAGLIGFRALSLAGDGARVGFFGFGSAAHVLAQVARWQGRE